MNKHSDIHLQVHDPQISSLLPEEICKTLELKQSFRGKQIFSWIHKGTKSFHDMSNIPKTLRELLVERFSAPQSITLDTVQKDPDGTIKIALSLSDGNSVEAVLLEDVKGRRTACISSQVGCAMGCKFCRTGTMGLIRNLSASEIIEQYIILNTEFGPVSHIVFMGMGEPLANLDAVRRAIEVFRHPDGSYISKRKMTISTCGLAPQIISLAQEGPHVRMALSLTSARPDLRDYLMPISKRYPLHEVKEALRLYQEAFSKRITLEYVLLKGINDADRDVKALRRFADGLQVVINLIPFNPGANLDFQEPSARDLEKMAGKIEDAGLAVTKRFRKGRSIDGACGQLATSLKKMKP